LIDIDPRVKYHSMRLSALQSDRSGWDAQWEESAARVIPAHRDNFVSRGIGNALGTPGQKKTELQFDATAGLACLRFAAVMESLSTPQNGRWHFLSPADKGLKRNRRVREFFDDLTDRLFSYRYRPVANFVGNSQQVYQSLGAYGNGSLFIDAPDQVRGLRYRNVHLGETYYVENHAGVIDTLYRVYWLTARQAVQAFPNAPDAIKAAANEPNQSERKFQFVHCVYPREDYVPGMLSPQGKPFASLYFCKEPLAFLDEGGYNEFPFAITRYTQASGEVYGRGPAQWVLPSIKLLNEEKKTNLKQGHRAADPVLLAYDDGTLDGFTMRPGYLNKGGISKDGKKLIDTLPTGNFAINEKMMDMERAIINDAFLISLFQILVENPQMTATEVLERAREKGMLLAPTAGRMQAEFLGPLIQRELELLSAQGLLPRMPPILEQAGGEYTIEYDSPMSRMQRAESASGFTRTLQIAAEYAKMTQDMDVLDHFDFDAAMPELLDINGAPVRWTRTKEQVEERRKQRAEAAQMQQMTDAAPGVAQLMKAAPDAAGGPA